MRSATGGLRCLPYVWVLAACCATIGCQDADSPRPLVVSVSALGTEGQVVRRQLARFEQQRPGVRVELRVTPDAADQRHQLYVQWLNARSPTPDILQLDIIWTAEFAAAGWIQRLDPFEPELDDFFPAAIGANRWRDSLYALPWFVDVGLLYWRTDLFDAPPATIDELRDAAIRTARTERARFGLVWQGARYEGLVTVFLEYLDAFGGRILDAAGRVTVDDPAAVRALTFMRNALWRDGVTPASVLTWQEEQVRFAFQNGQSAFMRNWPYAWALLADPSQSRVAGRVAVAPFPGATADRPVAALGGAQLAINTYTAQPQRAWELVSFLTASDQMRERAQLAAQLPARRSLYDAVTLGEVLPLSADQVRRVLEAATSRPVTPVYSELSDILQARLHRALSRQQEPIDALRDAAGEIRRLLERSGLRADDNTS